MPKTCINCGELSESEIVYRKKLKRSVPVCMKCEKESRKKYEMANRELRIERAKEYERKNKELHRLAQKKYNASNRKKIREYNENYRIKQQNEVGESYIRRLLAKDGTKWKEMTQEMIELKRAAVLCKRYARSTEF